MNSANTSAGKSDFVDNHREPVSLINASQYANDFGLDRTSGYRDAVADILAYLDNRVLYNPEFQSDLFRMPNSAHTVRKELKNYLELQQDLLSQLNQVLDQSHPPASNPKPATTLPD